MRQCAECGQYLGQDAHHNRRLCLACSRRTKSRPNCNLTEEQRDVVSELSKRLSIKEICHTTGFSASQVSRCRQHLGISRAIRVYDDALITQVISYYESNGKRKTMKHFPDVSVRSIVESRPHKARIRKMSDDEIVRVAQMAGFLSFADQAKELKDNGTKESQIVHLWARKFRVKPQILHGLPKSIADFCVTKKAPRVRLPHQKPPTKGRGFKDNYRTIVLWCDAKDHLIKEIPDFVRDAVIAMSDFQKWLYRSDNPKLSISKMISS